MTRPRLRAALLGLALTGLGAGGAAWTLPAKATTLSGAYLAAQAAASRNDYEAAARYFASALSRDPGDPVLRDRTMTFKLLTGDLRGAALIAELVAQTEDGRQLADLALVADDIATGDFDAAAGRLDGEGTRINMLVSTLLAGWVEVGRQDQEAMEAAFDSLNGDPMGEVFATYHRGLARAAMGDLEGAREALQTALDNGASPDGRPAMALGAVLERLGELDAARAVYERAMASPRGARIARHALQRMASGEPPDLLAANAAQGAAEALFSIAGALGSERNALVAMLYSRIALALRPDLQDARLLVGGLLEAQGRHQAAADSYQLVPRRSPLFVAAELGRAESLLEMERVDDAVVVLEALVAAYPQELDAQIGLASALRRAERWKDSARAYDAAISLIDPIEPRHWTVFYERGIAHERAGDWPDAEKDFFEALELAPDQPLVLNYLGYSWVEQGLRLDEAQAMIEKAVAQRPDDGYITDSLGWVLYRFGKYEEAVPHLERAVELMPTDPVINDHLGDALWMVGRKREADFQWRRAMSFDPDEKEAERLRQKLEHGLDAVLEKEAGAKSSPAAPAAAANAPGTSSGKTPDGG